MKKSQNIVIAGVAAGLAAVAGLYLANQFLIAPLASRQSPSASIDTGGNHPLAPDFTLKGINGESFRLADYRGKVLMIDFWATDCDPCRGEIPSFVELQSRYRDQGFVILGVSLDSGPEPVREFYKEFKMNYAVGLDSENLDQRFGGIIGIPTTFLVGRDGRIYAKHVGSTDEAVFEREIKSLLAANSQTQLASPPPAVAKMADAAEVKNPLGATGAR